MSNIGSMRRNTNYPRKAVACPCGRFVTRRGHKQHTESEAHAEGLKRQEWIARKANRGNA